MPYQFATPDHAYVLRDDGAWLPWDVGNNQPADIMGGAGTDWKAAGSPTPDPYVAPPLTPQQQFANALIAGVTLTWSSSTALNGAYAIDTATQANITAESVSVMMNNLFTNGQPQRYWPDQSGMPHQFTIDQFKLFATTIAAYVDSLHAALAGQAAWPSNAINVAG
jgi:hypothetical protein